MKFKWQVNKHFLVLQMQEEVALSTLLEELKLDYQKLVNNKLIIADHLELSEDLILKKGNTLRIKLADEDIDYLAEEQNLHVVYEDDLILIVDKPSGIIIHPDSKEGLGTLVNGVSYYYLMNNEAHFIRPLHRLDKDTSGLVLFSKQSILQPYFDALLAEKKIKRSYYAICDGYYRKGQRFSVEKPIARDRHNAKRYRVSETGKWAKTNFECLESNREDNISLVKCELESGRTHQIRVHLADHKHPIMHDDLYGERMDFTKRMALQAFKIEIDCPFYPDFKVEIRLANDLAKAFRKILKLKEY